MRKNLSALLSVLLLIGCKSQVAQPSVSKSAKDTFSEPVHNSEADRLSRINEALHSDIIAKYTQAIANGTDAETYIKLGDEYLKIAIQEDYFDGYNFAFQNYLIANSLGGSLTDHADKIVVIYEAKAKHAYEEGNIEDYEGYLVRANNLSPTQERYALIAKARRELNLEHANEEIRTDYHDLNNQITSYTISKMDESGQRIELSSYRSDNTLIDTYSGFEYDEHGNCLKSATFDDSTLKFIEERVESFTIDGVQIDTKFYKLGTDIFLGSQINIYDDLGRFAGIRYVDGSTGQDAGSIIYRYDENDEYIAYDVYDTDGTLTYHEDAVSEESDDE